VSCALAGEGWAFKEIGDRLEEINDDLMVLHAPAAVYGAKVSQKAIVTVAHPSQPAALE
jgi:hypothetical protein